VSVTWTVTAADQLQAVRDYLARSSPGYAQSLAGRIVARTEALDGQPHFGAEVPEYSDPAIREVFEHPYRVIYRVGGADVQVVAVIHAPRVRSVSESMVRPRKREGSAS
jgi:plasmid stabilization system protein ParE